jgi:hypothetical protein
MVKQIHAIRNRDQREESCVEEVVDPEKKFVVLITEVEEGVHCLVQNFSEEDGL